MEKLFKLKAHGTDVKTEIRAVLGIRKTVFEK